MTSAAATPARVPSSAPGELVPWLLRASGADGADLDTVPVGSITREPDGTIRMSGKGRRFGARATWTPIPERATSWWVAVEAWLEPDGPDDPDRPVDGVLDASVAVAIQVPADGPPDWLVPGLFYGENRPAASRARYPRWIPEPVEPASEHPASRRDPFASSEWWFRADRAATPAVLASGGGLRVCLATEETSAVGPAGVGFGSIAGPRGDRREIRLSFPYREVPVVYDGSPDPQPADRPTFSWRPGEPVLVRFRVDACPASAPATVAGGSATTSILRDLHGWLAADAPLRPWVRPEKAAQLAAEGLMRWHHRPADAALIETAAFARRGDGNGVEPGDRPAMHVAWLSGVPAATALLVHASRVGDDQAVAVARGVLDNIAAHLAPCGTFWGQWTSRDGWTKGWTPGPDALHARTLAEATLFLARAARVTGDPSWRAAVASNVSFAVGVQREDGAIPSSWNGRTGEPLAWAGCAGLAWVPALVEASRLLDDPALLESARRLGRHHATDVEAGFLFGAPEDVDLGPTSEDGYVAVMAYVALAEAAIESGMPGAADSADWIGLARKAADWMLSFRYAYNVAFPAGSVLDRHDFRTRGADLASPANQHLHAYGLICTGELPALSRLTGDPHFLERARETYACFRQFIARHDGDFGARRGMAPERYYQTRYDGQKGEIGPLSHAWCLGLLLHASELAVAMPELVADA
jgi:hypothetical protein